MKTTLAILLVASAYLATSSFPAVKIHTGVQSAFAAEQDEDEVDEDEECPAGFEETEEKCTPEEKANGCRDIRLDNGKGCVDRD